MNVVQIFAVVGILIHGMLAVLFALVWRSLQVRWALFVAVGFAVIASLNSITASGFYPVELSSRPSQIRLGFAATSLVVFTAGFVEYIGIKPKVSRWIIGVSIVMMVVIMPAAISGLLTRRIVLPVQGLFAFGWAILFATAMIREPRHGHGIVMLAMLFFPLIIAGSLLGYIGPQLVNGMSVVPLSVLGMTLLYTGLRRAHQQISEELAARVRAENELKEANELLDQRVSARTADLSEVIEGLESFNRSVSHDLRGPLGGIAGVAKIARDKLNGGDSSSVSHLLQVIETQATTSGRLVGALMQLARASENMLNPQRVDTRTLAMEVIESIRLSQGATELPVVVGPMPEIVVDVELARQVFTNLIGNALKFSASTVSPQVQLGATGEPANPTFFIRDNGIGFSSADASQLFRPFCRLHGANYEGTGIGLSIVKRIIDRHGGKVWAESQPGFGATFYFSFGESRQR